MCCLDNYITVCQLGYVWTYPNWQYQDCSLRQFFIAAVCELRVNGHFPKIIQLTLFLGFLVAIDIFISTVIFVSDQYSLDIIPQAEVPE